MTTTDRHLHPVATTAPTPLTPLVKDRTDDDGVKWLALLLRDALLMVVRGIDTRYQMKQKHDCPKCGWRS
jgi:hypothetical protein